MLHVLSDHSSGTWTTAAACWAYQENGPFYWDRSSLQTFELFSICNIEPCTVQKRAQGPLKVIGLVPFIQVMCWNQGKRGQGFSNCGLRPTWWLYQASTGPKSSWTIISCLLLGLWKRLSEACGGTRKAGGSWRQTLRTPERIYLLTVHLLCIWSLCGGVLPYLDNSISVQNTSQ